MPRFGCKPMPDGLSHVSGLYPGVRPGLIRRSLPRRELAVRAVVPETRVAVERRAPRARSCHRRARSPRRRHRTHPDPWKQPLRRTMWDSPEPSPDGERGRWAPVPSTLDRRRSGSNTASKLTTCHALRKEIVTAGRSGRRSRQRRGHRARQRLGAPDHRTTAGPERQRVEDEAACPAMASARLGRPAFRSVLDGLRHPESRCGRRHVPNRPPGLRRGRLRCHDDPADQLDELPMVGSVKTPAASPRKDSSG